VTFRTCSIFTARVANAIAPRIVEVEIHRAAHKPTESLDAYDLYLRGRAGYYKFRKDANDEALRYLSKAIQLDPDFALAWAMMQLNPVLRVSDIKRLIPIRHPEYLARLEEGLRLAGLPE
jgi:hypothetical protein